MFNTLVLSYLLKERSWFCFVETSRNWAGANFIFKEKKTEIVFRFVVLINLVNVFVACHCLALTVVVIGNWHVRVNQNIRTSCMWVILNDFVVKKVMENNYKKQNWSKNHLMINLDF